MKKWESIEDFLKRGGKVKKIRTGVGVSKRIKKLQKEASRKFRKKKKAFIELKAEELQKETPKSEIWFRNLYTSHKLLSNMDRFNVRFRKYIPDVSNLRFRYVIEIDGSIHSNPEVLKRDRIKDRYFKGQGIQLIRVKAYNIESYIQAIETILKIRKWTAPIEYTNFKLDYYNNK